MFHGDCGLTGKWVEVDIHLNSYRRSNEAIAETVKELVQDFKDKGWIESWHFFREPQIRLRFYGEENNIVKVKDAIENKLSEMESTKGDIYSCHVFVHMGIETESMLEKGITGKMTGRQS